MAWVTPSVFTVGQVLRALDMNNVSGDLSFLYTRLFDSTLSGSAATFDITGIDQSYAHLEIEAYLRTDRAAVNDSVVIKINNDAVTQCRSTRFWSDGTTMTNDTQDLTNGVHVGVIPAATAGANRFGRICVKFEHYAGSTNHKTYGSDFDYAEAGNRQTGRCGGAYEAATAITRLTLRPNAGTNFVAGSRCTVYGKI